MSEDAAFAAPFDSQEVTTGVLERSPPYTPKLNPVEYLWGYLKFGQPANFTPGDVFSRQAGERYPGHRSGLPYLAIPKGHLEVAQQPG
jgi:hypothetical protein